MRSTRGDEVMAILRSRQDGRKDLVDRLFPLVYDELRKLARDLLHRERKGHSLQPTELVNEVYLRLVAGTNADWKDRAHFIAAASLAMRRVLVDHARRRMRVKRGKAPTRVTLCPELVPAGPQELGILEIDEALESLSAVDANLCKIACMKIFGGLRPVDIAQVQGVSQRTIERKWAAARAWLIMELHLEKNGD